MEEMKKLKRYKWTAIAIHCWILFYALTQGWYTASDEFRYSWYTQFQQPCGARITLLEAGKMLSNWFDYVGEYSYFSSLKYTYTTFVFTSVLMILFICAEVYEILELLDNKIGGWSLITGILASVIGIIWYGYLNGFCNNGLEVKVSINFSWMIFSCGILPWVAVIFESKVTSLSKKDEAEVVDN